LNIQVVYDYIMIKLEYELMDMELNNHKFLYFDKYLHIVVDKNYLLGLRYEYEQMNAVDEHDNVLNESISNKMNWMHQLINE